MRGSKPLDDPEMKLFVDDDGDFMFAYNQDTGSIIFMLQKGAERHCKSRVSRSII